MNVTFIKQTATTTANHSNKKFNCTFQFYRIYFNIVRIEFVCISFLSFNLFAFAVVFFFQMLALTLTLYIHIYIYMICPLGVLLFSSILLIILFV